MTPVALAALVEAGESFGVEFKSEAGRPLTDSELVEACVCLGNGEGGQLLVGVEDDGRITGARPRHAAGTDPSRVMALIANRTQPALAVRVECLALHEKQVMVVEVPHGLGPVGTTEGRYLRRAIGGDGRPACVPFFAVEMLAAEIDRGRADFAALEVSEATWDDLDPLEIERFRQVTRVAGARADQALVGLSDLDLVRALGLVNGRPRRSRESSGSKEALTVRAGAILLFGRPEALARHVPTHQVAFQVLEDTSVVSNEIERWPLIRAMQECLTRFGARNPETELQLGMLRLGIPAYPEDSFREALANALVHRDYTRLGAVHVQLQSGQLEISNPGGLPPGLNVGNLLSAPPFPRNPLLADAFKRAGLVERTGRGINRIFEGQARFGRRLPDYSRSTREFVTVRIPGGPPNLALSRFVAEQSAGGRPLGFVPLVVLNELTRQRRLSAADVAGLLQASEADTLANLADCAAAGYVTSSGEHNGGSWRLSERTAQALGSPPVTGQGLDRRAAEAAVLEYVRAQGSITRAQAAQLCQLAPRQASSLLGRLVGDGRLSLVGTRRAARYEPVS